MALLRASARRCANAAWRVDLSTLNGLAGTGDVKAVETLLPRLHGLVPQRSRRTLFNTVLKACANAGHHKLAEKYFHDMLCEDIRPNSRTYGKLIEAAVKAGDRPEAERWFGELLKAGLEANEVKYNMLIDVAGRHGDLPAAEAWLHRLCSTGMKPSLRMFSTVMSVAAKSGDLRAAEQWMQELTLARHNADAFAFGAVVSAATTGGDIPAAESWLRHAVQELGCKANEASIVAVLGSAAQAGDLQTAERLFAWAEEAAVAMCDSAYVAMVTAATRNSDMVAANQWLNRAKEDGCDASSLLQVHLQILRSLADQGEFRTAEKLFEQVRDDGLSPGIHAYTIIVDAAAKNGNLVAAERWFGRAVDAGIQPDIVLFSSLIDASSRNGDLPAAEHWFKQTEAAGLRANRITFSSMVTAAARGGNLESAIRWAERARKEVGLDLAALNLLIDVHAKAGDLLAAEAVLDDDILGSGIAPDEKSFGALINGFAEQGDFDRAFSRYKQMVGSCGIAPSIIQYNQLLKACARSRPVRSAEAEAILRELACSWKHRKPESRQSLRPTRITLKALGRCVGQRRLSELCSEFGLDKDKILNQDFHAGRQKRAAAGAHQTFLGTARISESSQQTRVENKTAESI